MNTAVRKLVLIYIKYVHGDFRSVRDYKNILKLLRTQLGWTFLEKEFIVVETLEEAKEVRSENIDRLHLVISTRSAFLEKISQFAPYRYVKVYPEDVSLEKISQIVLES